jgi:predicted enzyme related to lactoylglutathione lyase
MKFSGICLITASVPRLVKFYEQVFSVKAVGDDVHSEICLGGVNLAIFSEQGMEEMAPGSMLGAGHGNFTIAFEVENVDAEYERIQSFPVELVKPPQTHPWGARAFWFRDPDGNILDLFSRVPSGGTA